MRCKVTLDNSLAYFWMMYLYINILIYLIIISSATLSVPARPLPNTNKNYYIITLSLYCVAKIEKTSYTCTFLYCRRIAASIPCTKFFFCSSCKYLPDAYTQHKNLMLERTKRQTNERTKTSNRFFLLL